jgi:hypothetical protein
MLDSLFILAALSSESSKENCKLGMPIIGKPTYSRMQVNATRVVLMIIVFMLIYKFEYYVGN